jgi:glutamine synthetase
MKFCSSLLLSLLTITGVESFVLVTPGSTSAASRRSSELGVSHGTLDIRTGKSQLDPMVIAKYNSLPYPEDTILAEYVWVDAVGNTRSKTRTLPAKKVRTLPVV